jgi:hypothetical protein
MKSSIALMAACALALSATAMAQEKPAMPAEHTMTGCLAKGADADTFIVNSTAEKGPKTIGIVSSKVALAGHVGHKIDITGVNVPKAEAEAAKPKPPAADHYMSLSAIKMVSATCP